MRWILISLVAIFLIGCSPTVDSMGHAEYSDNNGMATIVSAESIHKNIVSGELSKADDEYLNYRSGDEEIEELGSVELELARAHFDKKEYLLAIFYVKRILRTSTDSKLSGDAAYIMVHSIYKKYEYAPSDEELGEKFEKMAESFRGNYYSNSHLSDVEALLESYRTIKNSRYEMLAISYDRQGKPEAAEFYRSKIVE